MKWLVQKLLILVIWKRTNYFLFELWRESTGTEEQAWDILHFIGQKQRDKNSGEIGPPLHTYWSVSLPDFPYSSRALATKRSNQKHWSFFLSTDKTWRTNLMKKNNWFAVCLLRWQTIDIRTKIPPQQTLAKQISQNERKKTSKD